MVKRKIPRPTPAELEILRVLWKQGPSTVREVQTELSRSRQTGYTTALKFLQIMTEKGLVRRNESQRTHIYQARLRKEETQRHLVSDLLERAFEGSAARLATHALSAHKVSPEELQEIRRLLDELECNASRSCPLSSQDKFRQVFRFRACLPKGSGRSVGKPG